jgi:rRNA maturation endonuclease Nob1
MTKSKYRKNCKKCGAEYADLGFCVDKYCKECGNELPKPKLPKRCSGCKSIINEKNKFCTNCGKEVIKKAVNKIKS